MLCEATSDCNGMAENAKAPRNGTLRREATLLFPQSTRQKAARVPLSGCVCFPFVHVSSSTTLTTQV